MASYCLYFRLSSAWPITTRSSKSGVKSGTNWHPNGRTNPEPRSWPSILSPTPTPLKMPKHHCSQVSPFKGQMWFFVLPLAKAISRCLSTTPHPMNRAGRWNFTLGRLLDTHLMIFVFQAVNLLCTYHPINRYISRTKIKGYSWVTFLCKFL